MKLVRKSLNKWIQAAIMLVVGILVIVAGAQMGKGSNPSDALNAISLVLGWTLIVIGSIGIIAGIFAAVVSHEAFATAAMSGGIILAAGIWFCVYREAANLMGVLIGFIPFVMIVVGCILAVDALLLVVNAVRKKAMKMALPAVIFGVIMAVVSIVLGALCIAKGNDGDTIIPGNVQLIIFGIVNITSDSFSDGGRYLAPDAAIAQARKLMAEGADVIDLGPASSNPDAAPVSSDTEIARIAPVLDALKADGIPVSLDSYQPATQAYALSRGVAYLNDIRGFPDAAFYPQLAKSSARRNLANTLA